MFYANVYTACVFWQCFCVQTMRSSFSFWIRAILLVCMELLGLPVKAHQGRLMKRELTLSFASLPPSEDVLWQYSSAGWHCARLRPWRRELLSQERPSPGGNPTVSAALLLHRCHTSGVSLPHQYWLKKINPSCLSFIDISRSLLISNLK